MKNRNSKIKNENEVVVVSLDKRLDSYKKKVETIVKKMLRSLKKENCHLEIFLVNSWKMRFLNRKFRNKDKATRILTFVEPRNFPHPESKLKFLGEIYLNPARMTPENLNRFLAHGLLHLFGFSHHKKNDRIKMEKKEQFLITNV